MQVNNYIDYNGSKLIIKRTIIERKLKPNFDVAVMKEWTMSDTLLRKDGYLYCCETMQEASIFNPKDNIQLQLKFPEDH
tara:strand:+ start:2443 stop:2679 length:237 start_codon:yes stop_codon:yes gene_type:complete